MMPNTTRPAPPTMKYQTGVPSCFVWMQPSSVQRMLYPQSVFGFSVRMAGMPSPVQKAEVKTPWPSLYASCMSLHPSLNDSHQELQIEMVEPSTLTYFAASGLQKRQPARSCRYRLHVADGPPYSAGMTLKSSSMSSISCSVSCCIAFSVDTPQQLLSAYMPQM